ncbi:undecaprenyl-diphosphatase [Salirhabdus euzebyi]|uniref:Undecaprenyl-diphosphatase n=1 Tax=Salirhabdus euzebyi TaxID=394506 RepID=A0A841Q9J8_9BACI|nr:phosphatase PAP2 family protein [Salirhabdus euzebyi]MBB6455098.1 undecaprenyl-diphosphatase [Salirhabdus euzebyi]
MDLSVFQSIHNLARKNELLDSIMIFFSDWGIVLFIGIIFSLFIFSPTRKVGLIGFLSLVAGLLINRILKILFDRPRPFMEHDIDLLIPKDPSPSFPSDQALIAGIFATTFWLLGPRYRWPALILAVLVLFSRVLVGHHYPSDVLVGLLLGALFTFIITMSFKRKSKQSHNTLTI